MSDAEERAAEFKQAVRAAVEGGCSLEQLAELTRDHKARGLTQRVAYEALHALVSELSHERDEDLIIELMDFVCGWCQPRYDIWDTQLKT